MSDQAPRDLDWPTRRWLMWGAIAVVALIGIVLFFVWVGNKSTEEDEPDAGAAPVDQIEWSIPLTDMSQQVVTLKADLPNGDFDETWVDGDQLERGTPTRWFWDMAAELPQPVLEIDEAGDCALLETLLAEWLEGISSADGEVFNWQARAFTQYTLNTMREQSCVIDESAINSVAGG
jgi:hypothetical protein